ncbi:MAG: sugar phosphate isomerase/epimerase [Oscillospiraceae bacterium]|jgi:sugar phosphate isomerase/epimerase|nr:sugar phosphate isomerase/epimerase [Oscillospiraceae bacterium]
MKLGVLTVPLYSMELEEAMKYLESLGVQTVELGGGCYPGSTHTLPYITGEKSVEELKALLEKYNLTVSAIALQGNQIHPNPETAAKFQKEFEEGILLAEKLGVDTVNVFSGCPGDAPGAKYPNWVTCPWPEDFLAVLEYQWNDVLIPYWKRTVEFGRKHGVTKFAFEMHPGFLVYNPETLLRLRAAVGPEIGANFDPSHLIWQGMDAVQAIKELGGAIFHFHAKDTRMDAANVLKNGVLDTKHYGNIKDRAWVFRSVGYGHDEFFWKEIVTALQTVGYDGALSIEHEDGMMSVKEGLEKAIAVLKNVLVFEKPGAMWWA